MHPGCHEKHPLSGLPSGRGCQVASGTGSGCHRAKPQLTGARSETRSQPHQLQARFAAGAVCQGQFASGHIFRLLFGRHQKLARVANVTAHAGASLLPSPVFLTVLTHFVYLLGTSAKAEGAWRFHVAESESGAVGERGRALLCERGCMSSGETV